MRTSIYSHGMVTRAGQPSFGEQIAQFKHVRPPLFWDPALKGDYKNYWKVGAHRSQCLNSFDNDIQPVLKTIEAGASRRLALEQQLREGLPGFPNAYAITGAEPVIGVPIYERPGLEVVEGVDIRLILEAAETVSQNGDDISHEGVSLALRACLCYRQLKDKIVELVNSSGHATASGLNSRLAPVFIELNDGERVADNDIDTAVQFIKKSGMDQQGGLNLNVVVLATVLWYCDASGQWSKMARKRVSRLQSRFSNLVASMVPDTRRLSGSIPASRSEIILPQSKTDSNVADDDLRAPGQSHLPGKLADGDVHVLLSKPSTSCAASCSLNEVGDNRSGSSVGCNLRSVPYFLPQDLELIKPIAATPDADLLMQPRCGANDASSSFDL